ncbi:hypothetical protein [Streptococcus suis]|uniref:hypothetical protein n=1 Tax=Streptococcus suis TaxID=1307 RepID=UPI001ABE1DCF|nr:hypothetical protein [Streptococcus suis]
MKKLLSVALLFFFSSWLIYQGVVLLQGVWFFLVLLVGGSLAVYALINYFLNKNKWR